MAHPPTTPEMWPELPLKTARDLVKEGDYSTTTIKALIVETAAKYSLSDKLLVAIAESESGLVWDRKNYLWPVSSAQGTFQFLTSTFSHQCVDNYLLATSTDQKLDPLIQVECAALMIRDGGLGHWSESRHLWQWSI